jgi:hypothetical protein
MRSARHILFALFAFFAAVTAAHADVVVDRGSEIVVPTNAAYATRLAADELNFFLKGVLGEALPVVAQRTEGKTAIVLGGAQGRGGLATPSVGADHRAARDGYVIDAAANVLRIVGNDDDVSDVDATAALPDEAILAHVAEGLAQREPYYAQAQLRFDSTLIETARETEDTARRLAAILRTKIVAP